MKFGSVFSMPIVCYVFQDVVKILLQRGAGVNSKDKDNITALMEASIMDHRDVVKHLLKVKSRSCATAVPMYAARETCNPPETRPA